LEWRLYKRLYWYFAAYILKGVVKMRFAMRLKVVSVCAVFVLMFAGSAWGDASDVAGIIDNYFNVPVTTISNVSGVDTITVSGTVSKSADDVLYLGDITGLVIDWQADLSVESSGNRPRKGVGMINFTNGEFKLTSGTIQFPNSSLPNYGSQWVDAIYANGNATVTVDGGKVIGHRATDTGINILNGKLVINGGEITIPRGNMLIAETLIVNDHDALNGLAFVGDVSNYTATVYGHATTVPASEVLDEDYDDPPTSISYIVRDGAAWDIEGIQADMTAIPSLNIVKTTVESGGTLNLINTDWTFKGYFDIRQNGTLNVGTAPGDTSRLTNLEGTATNEGTINIYGTLTNLDKVINKGTINNYSGNTLDNKGTLINSGGRIKNASTGKIKNTGDIDNTDGEIDNTDGGVFQSVQTAAEMGGEISGPVEQINSGGGGGGCNAGFGMFGLLLSIVFVMRKYLTA
jgi:hypothetical protein